MRFLAGLALLLLAGIANAQLTDLAHSCGTVEADISSCSPRSWVRPTAQTAVLSCLQSTPVSACVWGAPEFRFRPFGTLPADAWVHVCKIAIDGGIYGGGIDPCGAGDANKRLMLKADVLGAAPPGKATVTFNWQPVTEDTENKPIVVTGYRVEWGSASTNLSNVIDVANVTSYTVTALQPGTYYSAIRALLGAVPSAQSNIVGKPAVEPAPPVTPPKPPKQLAGDAAAFDLVKSTNGFSMKRVGTVPAGTAFVPGRAALVDAQAYCVVKQPTKWKADDGSGRSTVFVTC